MLSSISHVVLVIVCDLIYFGGRLSRLEWAGIGLAVVSIVLLEFGRDRSPEPSSGSPSVDNREDFPIKVEQQ